MSDRIVAALRAARARYAASGLEHRAAEVDAVLAQYEKPAKKTAAKKTTAKD